MRHPALPVVVAIAGTACTTLLALIVHQSARTQTPDPRSQSAISTDLHERNASTKPCQEASLQKGTPSSRLLPEKSDRSQDKKDDARLYGHEEVLRLTGEARRLTLAVLSQDRREVLEARTQLLALVGTLGHRIYCGMKDGKDVRELKAARLGLVQDLTQLLDSETNRSFFPDACAAVIECLGASDEPAAVPSLLRHLEFTTQVHRVSLSAAPTPAFGALVAVGKDAIAPLLQRASQEEDTTRVWLMASALVEICGQSQQDASVRVQHAVEKEDDPRRIERLRKFADQVATFTPRRP